MKRHSQHHECILWNLNLFRKQNDKKKKVVWQVNECNHVFKKIITFQTGNTLGYKRKLCNDHVFTTTKIMNDHNDKELMDLPVCSL